LQFRLHYLGLRASHVNTQQRSVLKKLE